MPMNPEIKAQWVSALRSGEYQQGKHLLRPEDNSFCCLGVLCHLAEQEKVGKWTKSEAHTGFEFLYDSTWEDDGPIAEDSELPWNVQQWACLNSENPKVTMNEGNIKENYKNIIQEETKLSLAELNDTYGYTFNELANLIEAQL